MSGSAKTAGMGDSDGIGVKSGARGAKCGIAGSDCLGNWSDASRANRRAGHSKQYSTTANVLETIALKNWQTYLTTPRNDLQTARKAQTNQRGSRAGMEMQGQGCLESHQNTSEYSKRSRCRQTHPLAQEPHS